jgi:hypothetical protein
MSHSENFFYNEFNEQSLGSIKYWKNHQSNVNTLVNTSLNHIDSYDQAILLGTGFGNDLPLRGIFETFENTTLLDIDNETLKQTINRFPEYLSKIEIAHMDLTGFHKKYGDKYYKQMVNHENFKAKNTLEKSLTDKSIFQDKPLNKNFQFVVSSTVSTQLVSPLSLLIRDYGGLIKTQFNKLIKELTSKAAENHVKQIYNLLDNETESVAIITSEQYVWSQENFENPYVRSLIQNPEDMLDSKVQEELENNNLHINGRISEEMLSDFEILHKTNWIWQFNDKKYYLVKGWVVRR